MGSASNNLSPLPPQRPSCGKNLLIASWQREKESGGGGGRQVAHGLIFFSFSFSVIFTRVKPKNLAFDYPSIFSQQEAALHQRHASAQQPTHSTLPLMQPDRFSEGFSAFTRLLPSKQTTVQRHTRWMKEGVRSEQEMGSDDCGSGVCDHLFFFLILI